MKGSGRSLRSLFTSRVTLEDVASGGAGKEAAVGAGDREDVVEPAVDVAGIEVICLVCFRNISDLLASISSTGSRKLWPINWFGNLRSSFFSIDVPFLFLV